MNTNTKLEVLDFCTIEYYDNIMVCTIHEGEYIDIEKSNAIAINSDEYFTGKPFVYISNRKYSYAVDPSIYKYTSATEHLIGFAVVSKIPFSINSAKLEKHFIHKPFEIFSSVEDALNWSNEILKRN